MRFDAPPVGYPHLVPAQRHKRIVRETPNIHLLFGWLQVGEVYHSYLPDAKIPRWARHYPHVYNSKAKEIWYRAGSYLDTMYVSRRRLALPGLQKNLPGGGVFKKYHKTLCLTEDGKSRRHWQLPDWMYPFPEKKLLTYHEDKDRWQRDRKGALLETVARGQEFVLDCTEYPQREVEQWLANLFRATA